MAEPIRVLGPDGPAGELEREAGPWIQRLARAGFAAKGVVYALVAGIALRAALGSGAATSSRGVLQAMLAAPLGRVLLAVMAVGLAGYAAWRLYAALADPEGDGAKGRMRHGFVAAVHAGLAVEAARLALGAATISDDRPSHWTARALAQPFGTWVVVGVGLALVAYGCFQVYRAVVARLDQQLRLSHMAAARRVWVRRVCRAGMGARGVVFILIGVFAAKAGLEYDPAAARDMGGALRTLEAQPYGPWLLAIVAAGLFGYAVYEFVRARFRVIRTRTAAAR